MLYICACMLVCMCVVCVCMCVCMYVCMCVVCVYARVYACVLCKCTFEGSDHECIYMTKDSTSKLQVYKRLPETGATQRRRYA